MTSYLTATTYLITWAITRNKIIVGVVLLVVLVALGIWWMRRRRT